VRLEVGWEEDDRAGRLVFGLKSFGLELFEDMGSLGDLKRVKTADVSTQW